MKEKIIFSNNLEGSAVSPPLPPSFLSLETTISSSYYFGRAIQFLLGFPGGSVVKNLLANARDAGDAGSIPGSGRSPGGGNENPLQHSCLKNSMDRGGCRARVHGVTESQTEQLRTHAKFLSIAGSTSVTEEVGLGPR